MEPSVGWMWASMAGAGLKLNVGLEEQVPGWTKPAANKSLVVADYNHRQPLPKRSRNLLPSLLLL